jgi:hypothetical protein
VQSEALNWLSEKAPAFGYLSEREKMAILDFALLWSFFESRCLDNNANMGQIRNFIEQLPEELLAAHEVEVIAAYFRARYIENGEFTHRYYHLHLERSGSPQEVTNMMNGIANSREVLIGCLGILFRYRNNLFHGEKWEYELQDQQENFERSTELLRWLIGKHT